MRVIDIIMQIISIRKCNVFIVIYFSFCKMIKCLQFLRLKLSVVEIMQFLAHIFNID